MVDYLNWEAVPWNQQYEIVDRSTYEKRHFGDNEKTLDQIDPETYQKKQAEIDAYLKEINEELARLQALQPDHNNKSLSTEDEQLYKHLLALETELRNKTFSDPTIKEKLNISSN